MSHRILHLAFVLLALHVGGLSGAAEAETTLHRGNGSEIESLDPAKQETIAGLHVVLDAFEGLTDVGPDGDVTGRVAERWEISADGKTYVFHLRANAKWSNGDPITAEDYVYSWIRALDPKTKSPFAFFLDRIRGANNFRTGKTNDPATLGVRAIDGKTLQVELENPTPYFLIMLRTPVTFAVHRASVERYGDQWTRPENFVGNGAYRLIEWSPNVRMTFVKNEQYWDSAAVKIDRVVFYPIEDSSKEFEKFKAGELDMTYTAPDDRHEELLRDFRDEYRTGPYFGTYYFQFNTKKAPFDNPKVRRALALAMDRDYLVEHVARGGEAPAYGLVPPGVPGYVNQSADFRNLTQEQRLAEAASIMRELGYSEAAPLRLNILFNTSSRHKKFSGAVRNMWKQIHVEATLLELDYKTVLERRRSGDFQVNRASWIGDYVDPTTFLENLMVDAQQNDSRYENRRYDDLVRGSYSLADHRLRMEQLQEAEALMLTDLPVAPVFHYVSKRLVSKKVSGWRNNALGYVLTRTLSKSNG
ncbi:MAG: peptide ABC transporter substrate-binding protein [Pseudomonadota bacterium]